MKKVLLVLALILTFPCFAQNLQNSNWCFGDYAGLNFNTNPISPTTSSSIYNQLAGSAASVSDKDGQLLFYSNGLTVWGKNHQPMPNGTGLFGHADNYYHSQNTLIVPKPNHPGIYYLFTISYSEAWLSGNKAGAYYSLIDMCLNNGNGDIIPGRKNIPLKNHTGTQIDFDHNTNTGLEIKKGKITSTLNSDQKKVWVSIFSKFGLGMTIERYSYSYLVSDLGINNTNDGISPQPTSYNLLNNNNYLFPIPESAPLGVIKISPNGQYLCDASLNVNLYYFNNITGLVTFNRNIYSTTSANDASGYGLEFSPNSQLLYFSVHNSMIQEELKSGFGIVKNQVLIYQNIVGTPNTEIIGKFKIPGDPSSENLTPIPSLLPRGLQLGIDNKIYVCSEVQFQPYFTWIGIIQQPNLISAACDYIPNGINLTFNSFHRGTLPQWVQQTKNLWPKVYVGKGNLGLIKDNNGSIYMSVHEFLPVKDQINHIGFSPPFQTGTPANNYEQYTSNYFNSTTNTVWGKPLVSPIFALTNGTIQVSDGSYINAITGASSSAPTFVPIGEIIIAETNFPTQTYVTKKNYELHFYTNSSSLTHSTTWNITHKFNRTSNKLYISESTGNLKIFDLTNNTSTQTSIPSSTLVAIDNLDNIYLIVNNVLQKYDLSLGLIPVSIPGFNNNTIMEVSNDNPNAENKCLVFNESENNFYALDFNNTISRKIHINTVYAKVFSYLFDNNDVYIAGYNKDQPFYIGNQIIPFLSYDCRATHNCFITKLNLQTDFTARETNNVLSAETVKSFSFDFILSPNPMQNNVKINITETGKSSYTVYHVTIVNNTGRPVFKMEKYISGTDIKLYGLKKGFYYIELTNLKGEKVAKRLLKWQ